MKTKYKIAYCAIGLGSVLVAAIVWFIFFTGRYQTADLVNINIIQLWQLTKKAEEGNGEACWCLSLYYDDDVNKQEYWLRKSSEYGSAQAQYKLASILLRRKDSSLTEVMDLLQQSAVQSYALAQNSLGYLYAKGTLDMTIPWARPMVQIDMNRAEYWYMQAAMNGYEDAMVEYAKLLSEINVTSSRLIEAYKWLEIASIGIRPNTTFAKNIDYQEIIIVTKMESFDPKNKADVLRKAEALAKEERKRIKHFEVFPNANGECERLAKE